MEVYKIVLTGGPCAGKTTALSIIEERLTELGFHVIVVSESATELIKGGVRPFGKVSASMFDFQRLMIPYQLAKESIYDKSLNYLNNEKYVIIYDRGVIDNKAYINQEMFDQILSELGLNEIDLMDNYDMVLHLVTAADGAEKYYTLDNNNARTETIEEARELDKKTLNAWMGHPNLKIIDNTTNFEDKMNKILDNVLSLVHVSEHYKVQRKYLVDLNSSDLSFLNNDNSMLVSIKQHYIENDDNYEYRLRKRTINDHSTYYLQTERKVESGLTNIITEKKISEKDYFKLLGSYSVKNEVDKKRIAFTYDKLNMSLDIFDNGLTLLEVNSDKDNISLPLGLTVIKEVTNDPTYDNINIGKGIVKLTK